MVKEFRQFRNGYARAQATILLAYRKRMDALKSMLEEYERFAHSRNYELSQTVLFSMYALTGNIDGLDIDTDRLMREFQH